MRHDHGFPAITSQRRTNSQLTLTISWSGRHRRRNPRGNADGGWIYPRENEPSVDGHPPSIHRGRSIMSIAYLNGSFTPLSKRRFHRWTAASSLETVFMR